MPFKYFIRVIKAKSLSNFIPKAVGQNYVKIISFTTTNFFFNFTKYYFVKYFKIAPIN